MSELFPAGSSAQKGIASDAWNRVSALAEAQRLLQADGDKVDSKPARLFLRGLNEFMRAMPNHIARSSLFAPVARGRKAIHKNSLLVSRAEVTIKFWGEQLDEAQADVWMQAMHEATKQPLGEPIAINRAGFLRAIGRKTGSSEYKWLHSTMQVLSFAMLVIDVHTTDGETKLSIGKSHALHMIDGFEYDERAETYTIRIDPRWRAMYGNREFSLIDWEKRLRFGQRQDMAKALQRLVATSNNKQQKYQIRWLKGKLGYNSPDHKFRRALTAAMRELERLEIIADGQIGYNKNGDQQALWIKL